MNKEEILSMSRRENQGKADERERRIQASASVTGMAVGGILAVAIVVLSEIMEAPLLGLSAWAMYLSMAGSRALYIFVAAKERSALIQALITLPTGLACLIGMIVLGLRV